MSARAAGIASALESIRRSAAGGAATVSAGIFLDGMFDYVTASLAGETPAELPAWLERRTALVIDFTPLRATVAQLGASIEEHLHGDGVDASGADAVRATIALIEDFLTRAQTRAVLGTTGVNATQIDRALENLMAELEAARPECAANSREVAAWSARIAQRLDLGADDIAFVTRAGIIHDVGMLKVPREIVLAPRRLDAAERDALRTHAVEGENILREHPALEIFAPVVRSHHERIDGRGYPDNTPAGELPIAIRIVAAAAAFNAMISRRPYRGPFLPTLALEELRRNSGTQFDPDVVDALIDVVQRPKFQ